MKKFDLKKGLTLLLLTITAVMYCQDNTIRLTSNGVPLYTGGPAPDESASLASDDTVLSIDATGAVTVNALDPDYTIGSNTGAVTFTDALSKSITVRLKAALVIDQTAGSTYGAITTTGGIDRAGDGAIGVRPSTGTTNWGIENGEGITFGFSTSNLPTSVTLQITRIYFSTFGAAENGVIVNRRDTSKKIDFAGPASGTNIIIDASSLDLFVRGGSTLYDMVSIFNNSSTAQSWRVTNIEFKLVETNSLTTVWNGSVWSAFTPGPAMDAVIQGNYSALATGGFSAKKLTINSGTLSIEATKAVKVDNELINNAGPTGVVVFSGGGLRQVNNTVNTGAITVKRISNPLSRLDSKAWSSPIANQNLQSFSPATLSTNFLNYNEGTNQFVSEASPSTTEFSTAGGYLIGMPDDAVTAPLTQTFEGVFTGVTNNGDISKAITYGGTGSLGYNLIGNPYPSTVIANSFINANIANIDGSIYFYRKTSSTSGSAYAMYSRLGATNLVASSADTNAEIPVGEGFIVKAKNNADLIFTNAMRIASVPATLTADRVWLNLTNASGAFSQALVGYVVDGTLGVDNYDGKYINDSPVALTSNVNNEEYTIQSRPAFNAGDVVNLNFKTNQAGDYTIGVDRFDGVFTAGQEIYLKDNTNGTYTDLRTNSYTFTASAGTDNSRFVLQYRAASYPIAATAGDNGSVSGAGTYDTYSTATLIATPSEGYGLVNWTENGIQVSASPTYTFSVTGARTLVANFGFTNVTDVTACVSYTWNGVEYTASGIYVGQTIEGVVQKLNLTITAPTTIGSETISQCGGTYTWPVNNVTYSASTTEVVTVGCNTATLNLTITAPTTTGSVTTSICEGASYTWPANGVTYTTTQSEVTVVDGCNTATLNLSITPVTTTGSVTTSICEGASYTWPANGVTYTTAQSGVTVVDGCNTATLTLVLTPNTTIGSESVSACGTSYTWPLNGQTYTVSGSYDYVVECNTATLTLTLTPATNNTTTVSALNTYTWANNGQTYTSSGTKTGTTTNCVTELLDLTITTTQIPATFPGFCKGATIATATGSTSLKFYTAISGTAAAVTSTTALATKTYYVTETINGVESSPRVARAIVVNNLPTTLTALTSLEAKNICKYIGSSTPVTFTATAVNASSYIWTAPEGAVIENDGAQAFISFENVSATPGLIGSVTVKIEDTNGCISAAKALALTTVLPKAPTALALTSADTAAHFKGITTPAVVVDGITTVPAVYGLVGLNSLVKITKVGPYMGTETVFTLTAPEAITAASYAWTLPTGVNQLSGGNSNVITVDFADVEPGIGALPIVVQSVGGCGNSINRTLTLARALPSAPTKLVLTDDAISTTTAVTKVGPYTGKSTALTLTATPFATQGGTATSYAWILPAGVNCETSNTPTTVKVKSTVNTGTDEAPIYAIDDVVAIATASSTITINFDDVASGVTSLPIQVFGVNGAGNSIARTLALTAAVPATPAIVGSGGNGTSAQFGSCSTKTYTATLIPGATYAWTLPAGADIVGAEDGNVIVVDYSNTTVAIGASGAAVTCTAINGTGPSVTKSLTVKRIACTGTRLAPEATTTEKFSAVAYPNPATEGFRVKSSNGKSFGVQVYDMLGRSIEQRQMSSDAQIGSNYAKGIYNVIVNQGANVKTLRVIKQ